MASQKKVGELEHELEKMKLTSERAAITAQQQNEELQQSVQKSHGEMTDLRTKLTQLDHEKHQYKTYLQRCKLVIQDMREKNEKLESQDGEKMKAEYNVAVTQLKKDLTMKAGEVSMLKTMIKEAKENGENEKKLVTCAFYEMGQQINNMKWMRGSRAPNAATSWLGAQRNNVS